MAPVWICFVYVRVKFFFIVLFLLPTKNTLWKPNYEAEYEVKIPLIEPTSPQCMLTFLMLVKVQVKDNWQYQISCLRYCQAQTGQELAILWHKDMQLTPKPEAMITVNV